VGLSYITLGQPLSTFSGGEKQRLKIASLIAQSAKQSTLLILDEPTTGLHYADIQKLLNLFTFLISKGYSIIVIEHHLDVIRLSDWIIDMGPTGGPQGGTITAQGPLAAIQAANCLTGKFLHTS
jgi:excinuclease ABC subunit A